MYIRVESPNEPMVSCSKFPTSWEMKSYTKQLTVDEVKAMEASLEKFKQDMANGVASALYYSSPVWTTATAPKVPFWTQLRRNIGYRWYGFRVWVAQKVLRVNSCGCGCEDDD